MSPDGTSVVFSQGQDFYSPRDIWVMGADGEGARKIVEAGETEWFSTFSWSPDGHRILEKEPDPISTIQPLAPKALEHTIQTCLGKEPEERFQSAHDLKLQLLWLSAAGAAGPPAATTADVRSLMKVWVALAVAALAVVASALFWVLRDAGGRPAVARFSVATTNANDMKKHLSLKGFAVVDVRDFLRAVMDLGENDFSSIAHRRL